MTLNKHTSLSLLAVIISLVLLANAVFAQSYDRSRLTKIDHKFTIGFERQVYSIYTPHSIQLNKKTQLAEQRCNRMLFRMRLTNRFRLETGLSYRDINDILSGLGKYNKGFDINKPCKLSVPLTIQYQLQNERKRLHPYFGAGIQYTSADIAGATSTKDANYIMYNQGMSNNLKYINIIFTQGLIYDVTPDLQITQSIHILPEYGIKPVGINFGIGYRIK